MQISEQKEEVRKKLRERRVPSSAFGRAAGFAGMGASLVFGSMRDSVSPCLMSCLLYSHVLFTHAVHSHVLFTRAVHSHVLFTDAVLLRVILLSRAATWKLQLDVARSLWQRRQLFFCGMQSSVGAVIMRSMPMALHLHKHMMVLVLHTTVQSFDPTVLVSEASRSLKYIA